MTDIQRSTTLAVGMQPGNYLAGADQVVDANEKIAASGTKVVETQTKVSNSAKLSAEGWQRYLGQLDPVTRAQQRYGEQFNTIRQFEQAGVASGANLEMAYGNIRKQLDAATSSGRDHANMLGQQEQHYSSITGRLKEYGAALGLIAAFEFARSEFDDVTTLENRAKVLDLNVEAMQALEKSAMRAGVGQEEVDTALKRYVANAGAALEKSGEMRDMFVSLGLNAADLGSEDHGIAKASRALLDLEKSGQSVTESFDQRSIFGRGGQLIKPAMQEWSQGIRKLTDETKAYGEMVDGETAAKAHDAEVKMSESWDRLKVSASGVIVNTTNLLGGMLDSMNRIADAKGFWGKFDQAGGEFSAWANRQAMGVVKTFDWGGFTNGLDDNGNPIQSKKPTPKATPTMLGGWGGGSGDLVFGAGANSGQGLGSTAAKPAVPQGDGGFSSDNFDDYMAKLQLKATLAKESTAQQAIDNSLIDAARDKLKDEGKEHEHILSVQQAISIIGDKQKSDQIAAYARAEADAKLAEKHGNDFDKYLGSLRQEADIAGKSVTEKEREANIVKAAQALQKQNGVEATNLVTTYKAAADVLGKQNIALIDQLDLKKQIGLIDEDVIKKQNDQIAIGRVPIQQRPLATQLQAYSNKYGAAATAAKTPEITANDATIGQQSVDDYIAKLQKEGEFAAMLPAELEKAQAIYQQFIASHGQITDLQKQEIANQIDLNDQVKQWTNLEQGIAQAGGEFFKKIVTTGKFDFKSLFSDILNDWGNLLEKMAEQWIEENIFGMSANGGQSGIAGQTVGTGGGMNIGNLLNGASNSASGAWSWLSSAASSAGEFLGFMAGGGDVTPGASYTVGEQGPETFHPTVPGYIEPASSSSGGGGTVIHQTINAPGATPGMEEFIAQKAMQATMQVMKAMMPIQVSAARQSALNRINAISGSNFK